MSSCNKKLLTFVRALGFELSSLDWDGEFLIEGPDRVSVTELIEALKPLHDELVSQLAREADLVRVERFSGGPYDGRPHRALRHRPAIIGADGKRRYFWCLPAIPPEPAKWATYEQLRDGRTIFRGYATSEAKARRGEIRQELLRVG